MAVMTSEQFARYSGAKFARDNPAATFDDARDQAFLECGATYLANIWREAFNLARQQQD